MELALVVPEPDLAGLSAFAVYAVLWGFVFAECGLLVGFLLPGDTLLFAAGLVAAAPGSELHLSLLIAGTLVAAIAGYEFAYLLGRRYGRTWVETRGSERAQEHVRRAEAFHESYGALAVAAARWVPWVRTFSPLVAGAAHMDHRRFAVANVAGALPWAVGLPLLGYYAYGVPWLRASAYLVVLASLVIGVVGAGVFLFRRWRARSGRKRSGGRRSGGSAQRGLSPRMLATASLRRCIPWQR